MNLYTSPSKHVWQGRQSGDELYLHEKVQLLSMKNVALSKGPTFGILGYACDEGVARNQGRIGAAKGPEAILKQLAKLPNHLGTNTHLFDMGTVECLDGDMEKSQSALSEHVSVLLDQKIFPIILGGGHDMAYGHYHGIRKYLGESKKIGIINFDAHFDLRSNEHGNNSGTPFYQIAEETSPEDTFGYLVLGIRKNANDKNLYQFAKQMGAQYIEIDQFQPVHLAHIFRIINEFIASMEAIYVTIDLDGFSSAYAPGVSASSPLGFSPDMVFACLKEIIRTKKLVSLDLAEMNPKFDIDNQTAKLAAGIVHYVLHSLDHSNQD